MCGSVEKSFLIDRERFVDRLWMVSWLIEKGFVIEWERFPDRLRSPDRLIRKFVLATNFPLHRSVELTFHEQCFVFCSLFYILCMSLTVYPMPLWWKTRWSSFGLSETLFKNKPSRRFRFFDVLSRCRDIRHFKICKLTWISGLMGISIQCKMSCDLILRFFFCLEWPKSELIR